MIGGTGGKEEHVLCPYDYRKNENLKTPGNAMGSLEMEPTLKKAELRDEKKLNINAII